MNSLRSNRLDSIWIMIVVIHILGATATGFIMLLPFGLVMFNSLFWLYVAYGNRNTKFGILLSSIGWSIMMYTMLHVPNGYLSSMLMNLFVLLYGLFLHFGNLSFVKTENHIHGIRREEILLIPVATILLIIIGTYINSLSMLIFQNHVQDSLIGVSENVAAALLVMALIPAFVEELMFRGMVFNRLGNSRKAIFVSALLFALCHMNFNQICYAFVMGLFFAFFFAVTDNLLVTMVIHFLFNAYTVLMNVFSETTFVKSCYDFYILGYYPFGTTFFELNGKALYQAIGIGAVIATIACIFLCLYIKILWNKKKMQKIEGKEDWKPGIAFYAGIAVCLLVATILR